MALTSDHQSPSPNADTPRPYRLGTEAVIVVRKPLPTAQLIAIRASIQPRRGWWQRELRPWHYAVAISAAFVSSVGFVYVLFALATVRR